mgnify:CR=1 FL=1
MKIAFFGSSLLSAYWNGAATYYRGLLSQLGQQVPAGHLLLAAGGQSVHLLVKGGASLFPTATDGTTAATPEASNAPTTLMKLLVATASPGTFTYHCEIHPSMKGTIPQSPQRIRASIANSVTLRPPIGSSRRRAASRPLARTRSARLRAPRPSPSPASTWTVRSLSPPARP